jgi:hypothetical protein
MGNWHVSALRLVVVLEALTAILANAATTHATPMASVQRLTGRVLLIDRYQDRPLALVTTGWYDAVVGIDRFDGDDGDNHDNDDCVPSARQTRQGIKALSEVVGEGLRFSVS